MADTAVLLEILTYIFQRTPPTADFDEPLKETSLEQRQASVTLEQLFQVKAQNRMFSRGLRKPLQL